MSLIANFGFLNKILVFSFSIGITFLIYFLFEPAFKRWGLVDKPDNVRKLHPASVPFLGGFMLFFGSLVTFLLFWDWIGDEGIRSLGVFSLLFFVLGSLDDYFDISPRLKLGLQFLFSTVHVFYFIQGSLDFMGLFSLGEVGPIWSKIILSLMFVFLINAFNLIDGVNTLFGLFSFFAFVFFVLLFDITRDTDRCLIAIIVAGGLLVFLFKNKTPAKIFMGDSGSLMLGFILSDFVSQFLLHHYNVDEASSTFMESYTPVIALALFALPIFDMLRVIYLRLNSGKLPISPGRDHMHHFLIDRGFTHTMTSLILNGKSLIIFMLCLAMARMGWNINVIFWVMVLTAWLLFPGSGRLWITRGFKAKCINP